MSTPTKNLLTRTLTSKLEIERKFVPTPLLLKYASENPIHETLTLPPSKFSTTDNTSLPRITLSRLPRKRITDKYFDRNGALMSKGIWVRWRHEQTTAHDGKDAETTKNGAADGFWEAKVKQGGDYINSRFSEVRGRDAVEELLADAGVCGSVYDLKYELGFMADRVSWAVKKFGQGQQEAGAGDDAAAMTLVLDSMLASLEGTDGSHPKYMQHRVGELELEKTIVTDVSTAKNVPITDLTSPSESDKMNSHLEEFMAAYPSIFAGEGKPKGKLMACIDQKKELAARHWKANASGRFANLSEVKYDRLFGGE
jgi:thiamine-triphosphatase